LYEKALTKKSTVKDFSVVYPFQRRLLLSIFVLLLTSCSVSQRPGPAELPLNTTAREQQLLAMQQFNLQASVSVKSPNDSVSGNLRWQQQDAKHYHARLSNFLGIALFELSEAENSSEIIVKGDTYRSVDTSSLLLQLSGWSMPLQDMPLWLRGLAGAKGRNIQRDEYGRITSFNLTDSTGIIWLLQYQAFFPDSLALPKRLLLTSSDTQVKLVIRSWQ
jgi:outer membrane lipoprotein LolB